MASGTKYWSAMRLAVYVSCQTSSGHDSMHSPLTSSTREKTATGSGIDRDSSQMKPIAVNTRRDVRRGRSGNTTARNRSTLRPTRVTGSATLGHEANKSLSLAKPASEVGQGHKISSSPTRVRRDYVGHEANRRQIEPRARKGNRPFRP